MTRETRRACPRRDSDRDSRGTFESARHEEGLYPGRFSQDAETGPGPRRRIEEGEVRDRYGRLFRDLVQSRDRAAFGKKGLQDLRVQLSREEYSAEG